MDIKESKLTNTIPPATIIEDGTVNRYKYKYVYDEYGEMLTGYILYPNSKEWLDMSELGD